MRLPSIRGRSVRWPSKRRMRLILVLAGVLPALLTFGLLLKVAVMMTNDDNGREEFAADDFGAAAERFAANGTLNWFEPWISPFDEGAALHAEEEYDAAADRYREALETVPDAEECTVRINLALAHEALGDLALEPPPDSEEATEQWQSGIDVLAAGECPTDSGRGEAQTEQAATVDQRLRDKLKQEQQKQQQQQNPQGKGGQKKSPQEKDLDDRNQQGKDRREDEKGGGQGGKDGGGGKDRGGKDGRGGPGGKPPGQGGTPTPTW